MKSIIQGMIDTFFKLGVVIKGFIVTFKIKKKLKWTQCILT